MRYALFAIPLLLMAVPAAAAPATGPEQIRIPPELTDPKFVDRIAGMTEALSKALLDLPVGEMEAAVQGRPATEADHRRTVRDVGRLSDPNFERNLQRHVAESGPQMKAAMQALSRALPAMTKALSEMAGELERATANMPQPDYPKR